MARTRLFICGHDEDGEPWGDVIDQVTGADLYSVDGKVITPKYDFDELEIGKPYEVDESELRIAYLEYKRSIYNMIIDAAVRIEKDKQK